MTPFALAHLAVSWAGLTSLSLNIPAPTPRLTAAPSEDGSGSAQECAAGQLFSSLNALTSLQHLHLHMTGGFTSEELCVHVFALFLLLSWIAGAAMLTLPHCLP